MTAQANDLQPLTDADFNNIRSSIYSPNFQTSLEVDLSPHSTLSIQPVSHWSFRTMPMRFFGTSIRAILLVSICSPPVSIFGILVNRFAILSWIIFDRTTRFPCAFPIRSRGIRRIRMIRKTSLRWSQGSTVSILTPTIKPFENPWSKSSMEHSIPKRIRQCGAVSSVGRCRFLFCLGISPFVIYYQDLSMSSPKPSQKRSNLSRKVNRQSALRRRSLLHWSSLSIGVLRQYHHGSEQASHTEQHFCVVGIERESNWLQSSSIMYVDESDDDHDHRFLWRI